MTDQAREAIRRFGEGVDHALRSVEALLADPGRKRLTLIIRDVEDSDRDAVFTQDDDLRAAAHTLSRRYENEVRERDGD